MRVQIVSDEERFEFTPEGCEPSVFVLRRLTQEAVEEIEAKYRKREWNKRTRTFDVLIPPESGPERAADLYDYVIRDWREVIGSDGKAVPCTRDTKRALPGDVKVAIMAQADAANVGGVTTNGHAADPTGR